MGQTREAANQGQAEEFAKLGAPTYKEIVAEWSRLTPEARATFQPDYYSGAEKMEVWENYTLQAWEELPASIRALHAPTPEQVAAGLALAGYDDQDFRKTIERMGWEAKERLPLPFPEPATPTLQPYSSPSSNTRNGIADLAIRAVRALTNRVERAFVGTIRYAENQLADHLHPREGEDDWRRLNRLAWEYKLIQHSPQAADKIVAAGLQNEVARLAAPHILTLNQFDKLATAIHKHMFAGNDDAAAKLYGKIMAHSAAHRMWTGRDPIYADSVIESVLEEKAEERWRQISPAERDEIKADLDNRPEWHAQVRTVMAYKGDDKRALDESWAKNLDALSRLHHAELAAQNIQDPAKAEQSRYTLELISAHRFDSDEIEKIRNDADELSRKIFGEGLILGPNETHSEDLYHLAYHAQRLNQVLANTGVIPSVDAPLERIEHVRELAEPGREAAIGQDR